MKPLSKTLLVLFLIPAVAMATPEKMKGKYTKEKTIKKEFNVNSGTGLQVKNSYGNLDIVTWDENRTVIEVTIKTNGDNEEKVIARLSEIDVEFNASSSLVSAETTFENKKSGWSWWGSSKNNVSVEVNYSIKLPITNTVDLNNDYGTIRMNKLKGHATINCDYGQLIIGELLAENNYLTFDYTDKSTIGYMKSGRINADYSGFTLEKTERLELNADYTQSEIIDGKSINYNCDYGKVIIGKAEDVIGRGDYVNNKIGTITGSLNLNTDYGSINIDNVSFQAKNVTIKADYTGVKMGFDSSYNFDFVIDLSYASFKGEQEVTILKSSKDYTSSKYSGFHGKQNSGNTVNINSDYGGVTFYKN
ncbi:hypothetical protein [Marixanthomonas spongiae]|uniref:Adhesin domain-containing protein n=1 Tax=Marixanthomonas spongiae TaxID=2174845 RepID=A0A2U0I3H8_9FLAO|nr:hypothetical protein [Marixanthomonas spongiae]PVW15672.1 hypothetical protein DDV96_05215 [Marixanthomonas spongiae]